MGPDADTVSRKRYRYTGKERDEGTRFYYHGARYYIPWLARWAAPDPILSEAYNHSKGQPERGRALLDVEKAACEYEYCYDNPVRFTDPTGEQVPYNETLANEIQGVKQFGKSVSDAPKKALDATTNAAREVGNFLFSTPNAESTSPFQPTVREAALMADDAYKDYDAKHNTIGGWTRLDSFKGVFTGFDKTTGLNAAVYTKTVDGKSAYVYATGGTHEWPADVVADVNQLVGASAQYEFSVENAKKFSKIISQSANVASLTFVGHSLGGGTASANALATGHPAITFNAAALSPITKHALKLNKTADIRAFIIPGEILDKTQSSAGLSAEGKHVYVHPALGKLNKVEAAYVKNFTPIGNGVMFHLMESVNAALKKSGY